MEKVQNIFMRKVYLLMSLGLLISALFSFLVISSESLQSLIFSGPTLIILFVIEIALVVMISGMLKRITAKTAKAMFLIYSALNGLTISGIFFVYEIYSIFFVFLIAASMFFAMALYGLRTKKDLSSWGRILFGALIGLVIALIINMFWQNAMFDLLTAIIGVILFSGLTAYDNQMLLKISKSVGDKESLKRWAVIGALKLYLDFINLFLSLLRLMGSRR